MAGIEFGLRGLICFERSVRLCFLVCVLTSARVPHGFSYKKAPTRSLLFSLTARARGPGREVLDDSIAMVAFIQTELEGKSADAKGVIVSFVVFPVFFPRFAPPNVFDRTSRKKLPLMSCIEGVGTLKSKCKPARRD